MRTRNQPGKQHEDPSGALSDVSKEAVGRLLNRSNSCRSTGKKKQDSRVCWSEYDNVQDKQNKDAESHNTHTPRTHCPEDKVVKESVSCALHENKEDMSELDWEDGFAPIPDSKYHREQNVVVEFDESPSTSKKKPTRRATSEDKELAELVHKVHLLCLVARGRLVDRACNDPLIQAALVSLLPSYLLKIADLPKLTANALAPLVQWFHDNFKVECSDPPERSFESGLASALENRKGTAEEVAALSVALFRALNLTARFVSMLDVASLKPIVFGSSSQVETTIDSGIFNSSTLMVTKPRQVSVSPVPSPSQKFSLKDKSPHIMGASNTMLNTLDPNCHNVAEGSKRKGDLEYELQLEMAVSATASGIQTKRKLFPELKDMPSTSSYLSSPQNKFKRIKAEVVSQGISTALGSRKIGPPLYWSEVFCGGENIRGSWVHVDAVNSLVGCEEKVEAAATVCKKTLRYVVAFAGNGAKDVTRRYCTKWYTIASKRINSKWWDAVLAPLKDLELKAAGGLVPIDNQRELALNELEMMEASKASDSVTRSSLEDMELQTRALTEPLPTNQQAYRNHHLYAIKKWLTRYEMLRPEGPVLGYCSGHPVYPRTCVQTLHTKQRWLREGLQIKENESPAKMIKRSPKRNKAQASEPGVCKEDDGEANFALYGKWQTEPLDLPRAANGIVPKNERGHVDVWSEKCLPPGTVHLSLPRVYQVAKRLEIDSAPAMVGFEHRNGRSYPIFDGIVVCTEFKDAILEVYAEEEEKRLAKEKKQREAQAISRWYQLLSSILTRQRLKDTYGDSSTSETPQNLNRKVSASEPPTTKRGEKNIIPSEGPRGNTSKPDLTAVNEDHIHIFPLEDQSFDVESSIRTKRCPCGFFLQVEEF